jgi:hypothetical protein
MAHKAMLMIGTLELPWDELATLLAFIELAQLGLAALQWAQLEASWVAERLVDQP